MSDVGDFTCGSALVRKGVKTERYGRNVFEVLTPVVAFNQLSCDGHFSFGSFCERNPDGIAQAIFQQRPNAHSAFDATVFPISRFRHSQVQWIIHAFLVHVRYQQPIGLHHHLRIGGLHRNDHIVVIMLAADSQELHSTFNHAHRCVAVTTQDAVRQRSVICTNAHCPTEVLAFEHERSKPGFDAFQLIRIRCIGVCEFFEFLFVGVVAWIHSNLLHIIGGNFRGVGCEVNVCNQRHIVPQCTQSIRNLVQCLRLFFGRSGDAHELATGLDHAHTFSNCQFHIQRIRCGHGLNSNRSISSKGQ